MRCFMQNFTEPIILHSTLYDGSHTRNSVILRRPLSSRLTKSNLNTHFTLISINSLLYNIDASIVDTIIGDMFFHPDQFGSGSHVNAMKLFKRNTIHDDYTVTITNLMQFQLAVSSRLVFHIDKSLMFSIRRKGL